MSEPLKTIPEILGALRETANFLNDYDADVRVACIIRRIESGQSEQAAPDKESAYEEAWNRMIKSLQDLNVEQAKIRDAAKDELAISLDGTVIALEFVSAKMQEIQARIEANHE